MDQPEFAKFRQFIREQIAERGMTMAQFAEFVQVADTTIIRAASHATKMPKPSIEFVEKLARATGIDICTVVALLYPDLTSRDAEAWLMVEQIKRLPDDDRRLIDNYLAGVAAKKSAQS